VRLKDAGWRISRIRPLQEESGGVAKADKYLGVVGNWSLEIQASRILISFRDPRRQLELIAARERLARMPAGSPWPRYAYQPACGPDPSSRVGFQPVGCLQIKCLLRFDCFATARHSRIEPVFS
jgi:hypothetical protein